MGAVPRRVDRSALRVDGRSTDPGRAARVVRVATPRRIADDMSRRAARPGLGGTKRHGTLLEINNPLIWSLDREALLAAIAAALRRVLPFDRTGIFLYDPERDKLKLRVLETTLPSSYFTVGLELSPGESHVGMVFRRQQALLRRDLDKERQYPAEELAYGD